MEYDGTPFSGWQVQNNRITVQGELEKVLSLILNQPVKVIGSGRTDAGVHAVGQVANFKVETRISPSDLQKGLNSLLKRPLVIHSCEEENSDFHARYGALSKEYHYHILNRELPCAIGENYVWHIQKQLDIDAMNLCCDMLIGEHDFKSFEASGSPRAHTIRTIYHAGVEVAKKASVTDGVGSVYHFGATENAKLVFKVKGNGFLRFMVRNIVGTLVMAGHHRITPKEFKAIFQARNRELAGATAPARGLCLMQVTY